MKNQKYFLNMLFALTLTGVLLGCYLTKLVFPPVILPQWNVPNVTAVSLLPLVLKCYLAPGRKEALPAVFGLAALTCGLLPLALGVVTLPEALKWAVSGGVIFTVLTWAFSSLENRLSSGPKARLAPVMGALGLYLASQIFQGMLL